MRSARFITLGTAGRGRLINSRRWFDAAARASCTARAKEMTGAFVIYRRILRTRLLCESSATLYHPARSLAEAEYCSGGPNAKQCAFLRGCNAMRSDIRLDIHV